MKTSFIRKGFCFLCLLLLLNQSAILAQNTKIKGTVTDAISNSALQERMPGVVVSIGGDSGAGTKILIAL